MKPQDYLIAVGRRALKLVGVNTATPIVRINSFYKEVDAQAMQERANTRIAKLFYGHRGPQMNKWDHYLDIYDRHLSRFAGSGKRVRLLEIGVSYGGSLHLWREYFGPEAVIFGVDVDPECATIGDSNVSLRIGSQTDAAFLKSVVREMGGVDIVIDDGSHVSRHQRKTFETLFPLVDADGVYIVEDLHTSYFRGRYEGGLRRRSTFIEAAKSLVDGLHGWYHDRKLRVPEVRSTVEGIHFYDSMVVIEKRHKERPFYTRVGTSNGR